MHSAHALIRLRFTCIRLRRESRCTLSTRVGQSIDNRGHAVHISNESRITTNSLTYTHTHTLAMTDRPTASQRSGNVDDTFCLLSLLAAVSPNERRLCSFTQPNGELPTLCTHAHTHTCTHVDACTGGCITRQPPAPRASSATQAAATRIFRCIEHSLV